MKVLKVVLPDKGAKLDIKKGSKGFASRLQLPLSMAGSLYE